MTSEHTTASKVRPSKGRWFMSAWRSIRPGPRSQRSFRIARSIPTPLGRFWTILLEPQPMSRTRPFVGRKSWMIRNRLLCQYRCSGIHESNAR